MSGVLPTQNGKVVGPLETSSNVLDNGSGDSTIAGSLVVSGNSTVSGNLSVSGALNVSDINSPSATNAAILLSGATATTPFFSGTQGAAVTWNMDPPTVSGGSWNVGLGGGEFVLVNQYGGGTGGYGFWDGPTGGPFQLLVTISGAGTSNPGYTIISGGLKTKENTPDDGSGNSTIIGSLTVNGSVDGNKINISNGGSINSGQTVSGSTPALTLSGNGQEFQFLPDSSSAVYNPIVEAGDLVITGNTSVIGAANVAIVPWSSTKGGIRLQGNGNVSSANNVLDDGSGNTNISGTLTVSGVISSNNAILSGSSYFDGPIYFYNSVVGSPSIQTAPTVSVGTFTQNNSGGPLWLCLPVILGSNASANLYISSASSGAASVDVSNFYNGNSADMVATLSGLVPAGWWWVVSASGSYTVNSSSYPNGAVRII